MGTDCVSCHNFSAAAVTSVCVCVCHCVIVESAYIYTKFLVSTKFRLCRNDTFRKSRAIIRKIESPALLERILDTFAIYC